MKHIIFDQDRNFLLFAKEGETPVLSKEALEELDVAYSNAVQCKGWDILDWQVKKACLQDRLLTRLIRLKSDNQLNSEDAESVWEAAIFVKKWVHDINPFRDFLPDDK